MRVSRPFCIVLFLVLLCGPAFAVSDAQLDQLSREQAAQVEARYGVDRHAADVARVERVFRRVVAGSRPTHWAMQVRIVNDKAVNAFAFPNGMLYVNRGLLDMGVGDDELAFVMGHEIGHVTLQHGRRQIEAAQSTAVVTGILVQILTGGRNTVANLGAAALSKLVTSGYSRDHENEADREGLEAMAKAGYNPIAALSFFDKLKKVSKEGGIRVFASHPMTDERVRHVQAWLTAHPQYTAAAPAPRPTPVPAPRESSPPVAHSPDPWDTPETRPTRRDPWDTPETRPTRPPAPVALRSGVERGGEAPDVTLTDARGNAWHLGRHVGQAPILIYFWDARVPISGLSLASLQQLATEAGPSAQIVAVCVAADPEARRRAIAEAHQAGVRFPVLFDDGHAFAAYAVPGIAPQTLLIDARGRARSRLLAFPEASYLLRSIKAMEDADRPLPWAHGRSEGRDGATAELVLDLDPSTRGAEVVINGVKRGAAPLRLQLEAGRYFVQIVRPGATGCAFTATLEAGRRLAVTVPLL